MLQVLNRKEPSMPVFTIPKHGDVNPEYDRLQRKKVELQGERLRLRAELQSISIIQDKDTQHVSVRVEKMIGAEAGTATQLDNGVSLPEARARRSEINTMLRDIDAA